MKRMMFRDFPIDRAMLLASEHSECDRKLLRNVIDMGKSVEMAVLCEGIESREQDANWKRMHIRTGILI